jgi:hypothetical protein
MRPRFSPIPRRIVLGIVPAVLALTFAGNVLGALVSGTLPAAGFTYTSVTDNDVNISGDGVHLKIKGPATIKTTYSKVAPSEAFVGGWHYHNGPVIVTVTVGTLTFYGADCGTWDLTAGHTYIESTGQLLNAKLLPAKNEGIAAVEWFTTRLYPEGAADPNPVNAPC